MHPVDLPVEVLMAGGAKLGHILRLRQLLLGEDGSTRVLIFDVARPIIRGAKWNKALLTFMFRISGIAPHLGF